MIGITLNEIIDHHPLLTLPGFCVCPSWGQWWRSALTFKQERRRKYPVNPALKVLAHNAYRVSYTRIRKCLFLLINSFNNVGSSQLSTKDKMVIAGAAGGGGLLLLILIIVIVVIFRFRRYYSICHVS